MTRFRNIIACICLFPFLAASIMPAGLDLQMKICPHGEWGITVTSCSSADLSMPHAESGHDSDKIHQCQKGKGVVLVCGGDSHSKTEYFHMETSDSRYLSLPVFCGVSLSALSSLPIDENPSLFGKQSPELLFSHRTAPLLI